jgi:hypothetical protein
MASKLWNCDGGVTILTGYHLALYTPHPTGSNIYIQGYLNFWGNQIGFRYEAPALWVGLE